MKINKLEIPFEMSFSHSSATRNITDSIVVTAASENHSGYGEACPRSYVTAETFETVVGFFHRHRASIMRSVEDLHSLDTWSSAHVEAIDQSPAAWCAIELALLDLLARENNGSVEKVLGLAELSGDFQYTAVLGDSNLGSFTKLLEQYKLMGFTDFKLKVSGNLVHDKEKCDVLTSQISHARVRLDANNLWHTFDEVITYVQRLGCDFFALEEPLQVNDYAGLSSISEALNLKIIIDESFVKYQQFDYLQGKPENWILNIRISKMGGLLRSIVIAKQARKSGIDCIVGAQVGETSLLTRAALTLVNNFRDVVLAQEGACGTYLLKHDIFTPILMFGEGGKIKQKDLEEMDKNGFGLQINN